MTFHRAEKRFKKFSIFNKKSIVPDDITMPPKISYLSLLQSVQFCQTKKPIIVKNSPTKVKESSCQHKSNQNSPSKIFQKALKKVTKTFKKSKLGSNSNTSSSNTSNTSNICTRQVKKCITTELKPEHRRFGIYVSPECGNQFVPARFELSKNRQKVYIDSNENPYLPTPKALPGTIHKFPSSELKLLKFKINYYWKSSSASHNMTIPYGITFKSFLGYCQQEVKFMVPNDCIALAHAEKFEDDDINFLLPAGKGLNKEKINYKKKAMELKKLFEKDALKVVGCEDIWKIIMEGWNNHQDDDVIEVTLFSAEML
ncbi:17316_t:CDS:1 [Dentiscutata erythropus]|uniref:17316_t:CDS:1 n=1 Tax=Dentiscutata erythropus TaxID=1348616 RepID=A0A9N8ZQY3_9GLOM|nr:17316_t:CDS:1 [Dentiscutata erythropus]